MSRVTITIQKIFDIHTYLLKLNTGLTDICAVWCILTSFRVLRTPESWSDCFFSAVFYPFCLLWSKNNTFKLYLIDHMHNEMVKLFNTSVIDPILQEQ